MLAGGFLGVLDSGAPTAPLLRLPVLAGIGQTLSQTNFGGAPFELAWSDGRGLRVGSKPANGGLARERQLRRGEKWRLTPSPDADGSQRHLHTAEVELVLDPGRHQPFGIQTADRAIAQALSGAGPLPGVELHWTVHPTSSGGTRVAPLGKPLGLFNPEQSEPASLAAGAVYAPVVLRFPLYPVSQTRGVMPLRPTTIVFNGPAYDRDLSGPPASDIKALHHAPAELDARGSLRLALDVVNYQGLVTFMLDVRYERPMDALAQSQAEADPKGMIVPGGDLQGTDPSAPGRCSFMLIPIPGLAEPRDVLGV